MSTERSGAHAANVKWWPAFMHDEAMPPGRDAPSDWIARIEGDMIVGRYLKDDWREQGVAVAIGETLQFSWCQDLGECDVEIHADGTFEAIDDPPPNYTLCWADKDVDTLSDTLENLADNAAEDLDGPDDSTLVTVEFMLWGQAEFRLVLEGETPRFVPVATPSLDAPGEAA